MRYVSAGILSLSSSFICQSQGSLAFLRVPSPPPPNPLTWSEAIIKTSDCVNRLGGSRDGNTVKRRLGCLDGQKTQTDIAVARQARGKLVMSSLEANCRIFASVIYRARAQRTLVETDPRAAADV